MRGSGADYARFLHIALGSQQKGYHLLLAHDLDLIKDNNYKPVASDLNEISKMLNGFIRRLKI